MIIKLTYKAYEKKIKKNKNLTMNILKLDNTIIFIKIFKINQCQNQKVFLIFSIKENIYFQNKQDLEGFNDKS